MKHVISASNGWCTAFKENGELDIRDTRSTLAILKMNLYYVIQNFDELNKEIKTLYEVLLSL
ncbi:hypothetical protein ACFVR2_06335 [Gottfriedia sp. NPDC057991]|uniref:hypothetical protein n=1 Tax=Gottfriedia sp. NPDC057991 TaxID=3346298 RepID=UPI0036DEA09D